MWVVFALVLIAAAIAAYVFLCLLALVYVVAPLTPWVLLGGAGVGFIVALVLTIAVFVGRDQYVPMRTPLDVSREPLSAKRRDRFVRRDLAWPTYFTSQITLDAGAAAVSMAGAVGVVWRTPIGWLRLVDGRVLAAAWPLLIPAVAVPIGISAGFVLGAAVAAIVATVVAVLAWLAGLIVVGVLRTFDRAWQVVFRAGASCPSCYEVSRIPAYRCPGPHDTDDRLHERDLHRDIRPGRLGVLWRRCGCDTRIPTTVLRAARVMDACCPRCGTSLHRGAAVYTDVRISVFGAVSAGKTHLIMAGLVALSRASEADKRVQVVPADEHSERMLDEYRQVVDGGGSAPKTNAAAPPLAVTLRLVRGRRRAMLHIFDAAGEALADFDQNAELAYFDRARALIFVLDPFSIADVRDRHAALDLERVRSANPAQGNPADSYNATVGRLRAHGVNTEAQQLAFVVSKKDLLDDVVDADQAGIRAWLVQQRLDNLVLAAERDFGVVRYFLVSARSGEVDQPFRWLLAADRVPLPAPLVADDDVEPPGPDAVAAV